MRVATTLDQIGDAVGGVLVPTMGALHEGHAALIRRAVRIAADEGLAAGCVVSIFVNPTQFNDPADYERYPRSLEVDLELCRAAGAGAVFAPARDVVYPAGGEVEAPPLPRVATEPGLEDAHRPGHFAGVCGVVLRLFRVLRPRVAVFGEKDWQQLRVVSEMAASLGLAIRIEPYATVREADGLAMSSRNRHLSARERRSALSISRALCEANTCGDRTDAERLMAKMVSGAGLVVEYAVVRDARTLVPPVPGDDPRGDPLRALVAARAGSTRLIDNAPWTPGPP